MTRWTLTLPLLLLGCDDAMFVAPASAPEAAAAPHCPPGFVPVDDDCRFSEIAVAATVRSFDGGALVKVNRTTFHQTIGMAYERNVWISDLPVELEDGTTLRTPELYAMIDPNDPHTVLPAAFPVGTLVVHETVQREEGHTVQVKVRDDEVDALDEADEDLTDPLRTQWYTGKFYDDGSPDEEDCSPCVACHNDDARPGTDGLIGVPAEAL